eukprot:scaffold1863_cov85-Cylindrotheca_fusiformis.AAC.3
MSKSMGSTRSLDTTAIHGIRRYIGQNPTSNPQGRTGNLFPADEEEEFPYRHYHHQNPVNSRLPQIRLSASHNQIPREATVLSILNEAIAVIKDSELRSSQKEETAEEEQNLQQ